jgi:hypothetical protein
VAAEGRRVREGREDPVSRPVKQVNERGISHGVGSEVGTFVASFIIGAINAGIVSAGISAFYTPLAFAW